MKKVLMILLSAIILMGCTKQDEFSLGQYNERNYQNKNFKLDVEIPESYSYLTKEELASVNASIEAESVNPEASKYRNLVMSVEHLDGPKMVAFVDAHPQSQKNKEAEANQFLDFLSAEEIAYKFDKSEKEINGVNYLQLDLSLPFDELQRNYITVRNNKLVNIQINYNEANQEVAKELLDLYEE